MWTLLKCVKKQQGINDKWSMKNNEKRKQQGINNKWTMKKECDDQMAPSITKKTWNLICKTKWMVFMYAYNNNTIDIKSYSDNSSVMQQHSNKQVLTRVYSCWQGNIQQDIKWDNYKSNSFRKWSSKRLHKQWMSQAMNVTMSQVYQGNCSLSITIMLSTKVLELELW